MSIHIGDKLYKCLYCGKVYSKDVLADACRESHNLIYIPISYDDLQRLIQYIWVGDKNLLTASLMNTLQKYNRLAKEEIKEFKDE
jgi:hypothetical protein